MKKILAIALMAAVSFTGCKDENDTNNDNNNNDNNNPVLGNIEIHMDHVWGMMQSSFALDSEIVHPMSDDTMTFSTFKYYVSNVKLIEDDGTIWEHPESYFLVDLSATDGNVLSIGDVPAGNYTEFQYTLGVDSARNVSGAQTGALSVANGMFWSWNTGYIMIKAEGTSPQLDGGMFKYHLGGFSGENNVVAEKSVDLTGNEVVVGDGTTSEIHLIANPAKLFHTYGSVTNGAMIMMPGANATTMANDFTGGVAFGSVVNE